MLHITILAVGRLKEDYLVKGTGEYLKRLSPYAKVNLVEVADERIPDRPAPSDIERVKDTEGKRILSRVKEGAFLIALDSKGALYSSEEMAAELQKLAAAGKSNLTFVIGGSLGLSDHVLKRADLRLSFSKFTFPHQLFRLILTEQIYRWIKITRGEPYHL